MKSSTMPVTESIIALKNARESGAMALAKLDHFFNAAIIDLMGYYFLTSTITIKNACGWDCSGL